MCPINFVFMLCKVKKQAFSGYYSAEYRRHSWSLVVIRGHSWSLMCTFRQDQYLFTALLSVDNFKAHTGFLIIIVKLFALCNQLNHF